MSTTYNPDLYYVDPYATDADYIDCKIVNIRKGDDGLYAEARSKNDSLLIFATLDYIVSVLSYRMPKS